MPADIEKFYGLYTPAWHGLGYVADRVMSLEEALEAAEMDFTFDSAPVYATLMNENGVSNVQIQGKKAVLRIDKRTNEVRAYGPVGEGYVIHDLPEIFRFADDLLGEGAVLDTVGTLGNGERAFMTLQLPIGFGEDMERSSLYMTATTGFDGSHSTRYDMTAIRIVCANTWKMAHDSSKSHIKFRHTSSLEGNEMRAAKALGIAREYADFLADTQRRMMATSLRLEDAVDVIATLFPFPEGINPGDNWDDLTAGQRRSVTKTQKQRGEVVALMQNSPVRATEDTAWGLYNAVIEWTDHYATVRGGDDARRVKVLDGDFDSIKSKAAELLLV